MLTSVLMLLAQEAAPPTPSSGGSAILQVVSFALLFYCGLKMLSVLRRQFDPTTMLGDMFKKLTTFQ